MSAHADRRPQDGAIYLDALHEKAYTAQGGRWSRAAHLDSLAAIWPAFVPPPKREEIAEAVRAERG